MSNRPIGVFDSGLGGLTVLGDLIDIMPHEDFIYIGDTANCPYGIHTGAEITKLVTKIGDYLIGKGIKALVIACNTATAYSDHLRESTSIPVIGVIDPTVRAAWDYAKKKRFIVLATDATVDSGLYQKKLTENENSALHPVVICVKCGAFVEAIEAGHIDTDYSHRLIREKLSPYVDEDIDTVILGCTHFAFYRREIKKVFTRANVIDGGRATGRYLSNILQSKQMLNPQSGPGRLVLNTTGSAVLFRKQIEWFKKPYQDIYHIDL